MILTGAGQIGMAIARRVGYGMKIMVGDKNTGNAETLADIMNNAGFDCMAVEMDLSSRKSIKDVIAKARKCGESTQTISEKQVMSCYCYNNIYP